MIKERVIYGVGGGNPRDERMQIRYKEIGDLAREQSSKEIPNIALLPTAQWNGLHPEIQGREFISECFTNNQCYINEILLGDVKPSDKETSIDEVKEILKNSDLLFVLGGDTRHLLRTLESKGLIPTFIEAYESGLVFSGSSAGLIWLSETCMSDSESASSPNNWSYIMLQGIGVLPLPINVHDNAGIAQGVVPPIGRQEQFENELRDLESVPGLAVDEFVAVEVRNGMCVVHSPDERSGAYIVASINGQILRRKIEGSIDLLNSEGLLEFLKK